LFNHVDSPIFNISIGEIFKYCACASCTIQYTIGEELTHNPQNPPIRIKMKIGDIEFEIEAQPDQIQTAVNQILTTVTEHSRNINLTQNVERPTSLPRAETCRGVIQKLWEEKWFSEPRGLEDVHSELARKGFHYDRTAVAHALVDLVKDNVLTRIGKPRRYQYAQKRPPT
jgi:nicotinic acid phosphoribosyltransferase